MPYRLTLFLALPALLFAQPEVEPEIELFSQKLVAATGESQARDLLQDFFRGSTTIRALKAMAQAESATLAEIAGVRAERADNVAARLRAGSARMFRQTGSANLGAGATSAVAKTSATEFISMAIESGAVTSNSDKSSATFQLNALPAWQFLSQYRGPYGCGGVQLSVPSRSLGVCQSGPGFWLRGLTGSVSLNVNSKETAIPVLGSAAAPNSPVVSGVRVLTNPSKLSSFGVKYELFQPVRSTKAQTDALTKMKDSLNANLQTSEFGLKLNSAIEKIVFASDPEKFNTWVNDSVAITLPKRANAAETREAIRSQFKKLRDQLFQDSSLGIVSVLREIQPMYDAFVNKIAETEAENLFKKSLAFDFVHSQPTDQPALNTIRLDFNTPIGRKSTDNKTGSSASLDFNAAVALYHRSQVFDGKNVRLRNASASLALNYRMPSWGEMGSPVLTLAGYYQYMFNNSLIEFNSDALTPGGSQIPLRGPALEVLNTKGAIGLGQLRLEIPLGKDSGLTFPIAFSYANRTELLKDPNRKFWQGHIGLSYDLAKLQAAWLKRSK